MNITILGGTGLIGTALAEHLGAEHHVQTFGRAAFESLDTLKNAITGSQLVIQLSGANIGARWKKGYTQELMSSRIDTTQLLNEAIAQSEHKPERVICASAIGFYPQNFNCEAPYDEQHTLPGEDFLANLSVQWEAEANNIAQQMPTLITRFGVVLSTKGGALQKMLPAFKLGLGGPVAGGQQCFSWIGIHDLCRAMEFVIAQPELDGVINLTAPQPLKQKDFATTLGKVLHRPAFLPLPEWQLKLMFGEGAQVLTHSAAVKPTRLLELGFQFESANAFAALEKVIAEGR